MSGLKFDLNSVTIWKGLLSERQQALIVEEIRTVARSAPFRRYETLGGHKMSVRMSAAGKLGWVTDRKGYRYQDEQPSGDVWPEIPKTVLSVWKMVTDTSRDPDSCLINFYDGDSKMGLHQDKDETDLTWPVVSISLGDDALFRVGQTTRGGPTQSHWLQSGDVAVLADQARLAYHGIDRIRFGSSRLLPDGGRINVTLRVAG